jgi:hypothetical protein
MNYTNEMLEMVEKHAALLLELDDIAILIDVDCDELKADISNKYSEVSKRYRKGQLTTIVDLHKQEIDLAKLGSPMAMENTRKFILSQKLSENV